MGQSHSVPALSELSPSVKTMASLASNSDSNVSPSNSSSNVFDSCQRSSTYDGLQIKRERYPQGDVVVESLGIYMSPIESKVAFNHHFLIVEVDHVQMPEGGTNRTVGFIKAEKAVVEKRGIIKVESSGEFNARAFEKKRVYTLRNCGTVPMEKLLDVLTKPSSRYNLLTDNCWKYADQTFRRLIEEFSNLAEPESETKKKLQSYLATLPPLRLPGDAFDFNVAVVSVFAGLALVPALWYLYPLVSAAASTLAPRARALLRGLGSHPLSRATALQSGLKSAAAPSVGVASLIGQPVLFDVLKNAIITWASQPAVPVGLLHGLGMVVASPGFFATMISIIGGTFIGLLVGWALYKLVRGLQGGLKDDIGFVDFLRYLAKGLFGWCRKPLFKLFNWIYSGWNVCKHFIELLMASRVAS